MAEMRNAYKILVGDPERRRPVRRSRLRLDDTIKMGLKLVVCEDVECIALAKDGDQWRAFAITVMNLWIIKDGKFID
jgi:hypothetical protein